MDMLDAEIECGSIMRFIADVKPCEVHLYDLQEGFSVPALYLPTPFSFDAPDSLTTYRVTYQMPVKVFADTTRDANLHAEAIARAIRGGRSLIPVYTEDGAATGNYVKIAKAEVRGIDTGVAQVMIEWDSRYKYDNVIDKNTNTDKIRNFVLRLNVK